METKARLIALGRPEELKIGEAVTPPGTKRYELTCAAPADALAREREIPEVRDATIFGDTLHVLVAEELSPEELL